jgi:hypothetical protein
MMTKLPVNLKFTILYEPKIGEKSTIGQAPKAQPTATQAAKTCFSKKTSSTLSNEAYHAPRNACSICLTNLTSQKVVSCARDICAGGMKYHEICASLFPDGKDAEGIFSTAIFMLLLTLAGHWICRKCVIREASSSTSPVAAEVCGICHCDMANEVPAPCGNDDCKYGLDAFHLICAEKFPDGKDDQGKVGSSRSF